MNTGDYLQAAIVAIILVGFVVISWRGGARNPVGTGGLDRRLTEMSGELSGMRKKVVEIEGRVEAIENNAASSEDIARLEKALGEHVKEFAQMRQEIAAQTERIAGNRRAIDKVAKVLPEIESRQRAHSDQVANLKSDGASRSATLTHVREQVDRLYDVLVERGVAK